MDVSANISLKQLYLGSMPSLNKVCVWVLPFPPAGVVVELTGSPNVEFTRDCGK